MFHYCLDLVKLCGIDVIWHTHYKGVARGIEPSFVREQRHRMFRRRVALGRGRVQFLVHRKELLRHGRVFGIDPFALVIVRIINLETFCEIESVVERGAEIADLPIVAQPVYMVATRLQKAGVQPCIRQI